MQRQAIQPNATASLTFFAIGLCLLCVTSRADDDSKLHDYTHLDANYQRLLAFKPKKDPKTGFIVGGMNSTETIRGLKEINGITIAGLESSMRPGKLSKAGFLGDKERLLEIMAADNDWVVKARLTHQEIARHLRVLSVVSRGESEPFVYHGTRFRAKIIQYDGFQESPFNDGTKASDDVALENLDNGEWIRYSLLVPMMIERYGFYEGKGTSYRVAPEAVVRVLPFLTAAKQTGREQLHLESGKYALTLDVPAMANKGPIKAEATVRIDSNKVSVEVARPAVKLVGRICEDGKLRLGVTTLERNRVVSNHYIGDVKEGTASGKVHFFSNGEIAFTGTWKLEPKKSVE